MLIDGKEETVKSCLSPSEMKGQVFCYSSRNVSKRNCCFTDFCNNETLHLHPGTADMMCLNWSNLASISGCLLVIYLNSCIFIETNKDEYFAMKKRDTKCMKERKDGFIPSDSQLMSHCSVVTIFIRQQRKPNQCWISHSFWPRLDEVDADPTRSCDITNLAEPKGWQLVTLPLPPLIYK